MKDKIIAGFLALFFGGFGLHKFYLNRPFSGLIYLLFSWTFIPSVIAFFEALIYFFQDEDSFNKEYNSKAVGLIQSNLVCCPFCAEQIQQNAIYCKHCQKDLK